MIVTTRTDQTRYSAQTHQQTSVDVRTYVCDFDGCAVAQEEGHAPEDVGRIPRGWRVVGKPGAQPNTQLPIYCPAHSLSDLAAKPVDVRPAVEITLAREIAESPLDLIRGRR